MCIIPNMGYTTRHILAMHQGVRVPCDHCEYRALNKDSILRHVRGVQKGNSMLVSFVSTKKTGKAAVSNIFRTSTKVLLWK